MNGNFDATEIAAALLIEARAMVAQEDASEVWLNRQRPASAVDVLMRAWSSHLDRSVGARQGFASARRAIERVAERAGHEPVPTGALLDVLDRAVMNLQHS
jgi:hypothetical protein